MYSFTFFFFFVLKYLQSDSHGKIAAKIITSEVKVSLQFRWTSEYCVKSLNNGFTSSPFKNQKFQKDMKLIAGDSCTKKCLVHYYKKNLELGKLKLVRTFNYKEYLIRKALTVVKMSNCVRLKPSNFML